MSDLDPVIKTLIAEALGEGDEGMRMVAETILTRADQRGLTPSEVVQQPYQYTGYSNPGPAAVRAFNDPAAISAAEAAWALAQGPDDPTGGANHYLNPRTATDLSWMDKLTPTVTHGRHAFYTDRPVSDRAVLTELSVRRDPPNPRTQSQDLSLMRNPNMSQYARDAQVTPFPRSQSTDLLVRRSPGQTIATIPTGGTASNAAAMREAERRAALTANQSFVERGAPYQARPAGYGQAMTGAERRAALLMNQSYAGQDGAGNLRNARLPQGSPYQNYSVAANGAPGLTRQQYTVLATSGQLPQTPFPATASAGLQQRRNYGAAPNPLQMSDRIAQLRGGTPMMGNAALQAIQANVAPTPQTRPANALGYAASSPQGLSVMAATPVQQVRNMGYNSAQAYGLANAIAKQAAYEQANGSDTRSDWFRDVTSGGSVGGR